MDIISRLPLCAGQAADAVSAYTQVKGGGRPNIIETSEILMSRFMDTSSRTQVAQIVVQHCKTDCST